jgi:hypothetical protein
MAYCRGHGEPLHGGAHHRAHECFQAPVPLHCRHHRLWLHLHHCTTGCEFEGQKEHEWEIFAWQCQKQKGISLSSCQSEYIAAATAACQGVWLGHLPLITELCVDNMSAIQLCKNPVFHDRSKQIEGRYHFIREFIEDETVTVDFIGTDEQLTDIFTKALGRVRFQVLRWKIKVFEVK